MGLCHATSKWLDRLWAEHLEMSQPARTLVQTGVEKQGIKFAGFPADLHGRLYLQTDPAELPHAPEWARRLHEQAAGLGEWQQLRVMTARNPFSAGIATEVVLEALLPLVPERPAQPATLPDPHTPPHVPSAGEEPQVLPDLIPDEQTGDERPDDATGQLGVSDADLRAALRRAARTARDAVHQAEAELEGMAGALGRSSPGSAIVRNPGAANLAAIREAYLLLASSRRLRRIAELAGRLERAAASKARSRVRPGVGEVHGIGLGSDLARLLPVELVSLRHPRLRTLLVAKLLEHRALVYEMEAREPQMQGPIVILLDESGSMEEEGKDVWSKAVALALLSTATRQKRSWHLVAFNGAISREIEIVAGHATPTDIQRALDHGCGGGTDFSGPVLRAADIIEHSVTMKRADVVIVTDGEDELSNEAVEAGRRLTRTEGVSWFVVGVGPDADLCLRSLGAIATEMVRIVSTCDSDEVLDVINLEAAKKERPWRG